MNWVVRFLMISRKQWPWMTAGIVLGVVVIAANSLLMALSGWFIASMSISGSSGAAFNYFFPSAGIRFLAIARTVGRYAERLVTHEATFRILAELRVWLFKRFVPLAPACLERYAGGDVSGRLRADVDALETLYLRIIAPIAVGAISIAVALVFLLWFSPPSALVMLLFLLLAGVGLPLMVRRFSREPGRRSALLAAELRNKVTEGLQGVEELILLGAVERQAALVDDLSSRVIVEQERLGRINGIALGGMALFAGSGVAAVLLTAGMQVAAHQIPPPNLVMLLLFSAAIFEAAGQLPSALHLLPAARESASRIFELADAPIPVPDNPVPCGSLPTDHGICFSNVSASYHPGKPVLQDVTLNVPDGGSLVITGSSGIGKSLLVEILLRFRDYQGSITVGGIEIRDLSKETLIGMIAAVPQRPHLFNGSIRDNILLGNASADEEQLQQALRDSALESWVAGLPLGLATPVGINGSAVSGGEARRIALARALLKGAPILLLDEPTEGLDATTEREVVSRLNGRVRAVGGTTMLIVSHRPACLELGDAIVRLERS
ncbi:MAG: thiol reductant ABC exporter subunit CydC [Desulfuromonadales bacterium]|nr:thiol reductant ABC exporter subunit CydC [Desulfuromonadales bacterium]